MKEEGAQLGMLQQGRAPLSAEVRRFCRRSRDPARASTGPRSFERGGPHLAADFLDLDDASTGPRSFERGGHITQGHGVAETNRFNRAALL